MLEIIKIIIRSVLDTTHCVAFNPPAAVYSCIEIVYEEE
jgi:hypothetical protein